MGYRRPTEIVLDHATDFIGVGQRSPSQQYMLAYGSPLAKRDDDKFGDHDFVLFSGKKPIFRARLADRIHDTRVDNSGNFCLQTFEWPNKGSGETFMFFRADGTQYASIFAPKYPTLLGLEDSGNRVVFAADQKLFVLTVLPLQTLAAFGLSRMFHPRAGFTDPVGKLVSLSVNGSDFYRFTFEGEFLDERSWFRDFTQSADGLTLYFAVRDKYCAQTDWTAEQYREAADLIALALEKGIKDSFHLSRSDVFRFLEVLRRYAGDLPGAEQAATNADEVLDGFRIVDLVDSRMTDILQRADPATLRDNLQRLEKAESYPRLDVYRNYFGRLFKFKGQLHLALGERDNAIQAFRRALEINPRVGCKKQLKAIESD
jgi:hypothetical protein